MVSSVTLDNASGSAITLHANTANAKRVITGAHGLIGLPPVRASIRPRPTAHGSIDDTRWTDGALVVLEGEITSDTSIEDCLSEFRTITTPMLQTLDSGAALLKWTEGSSGNQLQRLVKLAGEIDPPITGVGAYLTYQAQFLAADPRAYSQTQVTTVGAALSSSGGGLVIPFTFPFEFNESSGGAATWTQAGNRPTIPTFKIYGACSSPRLRLLSTNEEIVLTGEVSAGAYLEVGTDSRGQRYVRLNGSESANRANLIDFTATEWMEIPPGSQTIQLLATTFDASAHVEVLTRAAYA